MDEKDFNWFNKTFKSAVKEIGHTVMVLSPWNNPLPFTRAWCIWEVYSTAYHECPFEIAMSKNDRLQFINDVTNDTEGAMKKMLATVRAEKSQCYLDDDREKIFSVIRGTLGFEKINSMVFEQYRSWTIQVSKDSMLKSMSTLGLMYQGQGKYDMAETILKNGLNQALELSVASLHQVECKMNLASVYMDQGKYQEATPLVLECFGYRAEKLGKDHMETLDSADLLARAHSAQGEFTAAEALLKQCYFERKQHLGTSDPKTIASMNRLGVLHMKKKEYVEAKELFEKAHQERKKALGENHPDTLTSLNNLAVVYMRGSELDKAKLLLEECLMRRREILGEDHPDTLTLMNNIASLNSKRGDYGAAEQLLERCYEDRRLILGEDHPDTLATAENLEALACRKSKRHGGSESEIWSQSSGDDGFDNLSCRSVGSRSAAKKGGPRRRKGSRSTGSNAPRTARNNSQSATCTMRKTFDSSKILPKCVCSWKNCRTYQKAYRSYGHQILDGIVKVKFIKGDIASIPLKASVDRTLKVSEEKQQDWKPVKDEETMWYNIARHHFTEAHIQRYLRDPKQYKWTSLFSAAEAKKYLFKLDPKETMSLGDAEVYYFQCPNVSKDFVKEQFLKMKEEMEEKHHRTSITELLKLQETENKRLRKELASCRSKLTHLNETLPEDANADPSAPLSFPYATDDPSKLAQLLKLQEEENERLRKELDACESQLSYLNEIVRQLHEDANVDNMSVYSWNDDESEWDGGNDDDQDWSEDDDTINDDESSAFLGPAMKRRNSLNSRQSSTSASQTVKSLPREIELAEVEANGSGSEDSGLKDDFDEMSYVSRGSQANIRNRNKGGDSGDGDGWSVNSRQSRRRDKNRRQQQRKGSDQCNHQNNNKSSSSNLDAGCDDKKSVSWDGNDVELYEVKQHAIVDPYGERGTYIGTLSKATGMPHGKGRLEYAAGRWYEGEWQHGRWTGQGQFSYADGAFYEGEFRNDHRHGKGTMKYADGRVFVGEYVNGEMTEGKMIYQDGSTYEGGWADRRRHGRGRCVFTDESIYDGEFREGEFHGHGKMTWSDGGWYEGEWWNGEMHGQGKEIRPNGTVRHEGAWSKGQQRRKRK